MRKRREVRVPKVYPMTRQPAARMRLSSVVHSARVRGAGGYDDMLAHTVPEVRRVARAHAGYNVLVFRGARSVHLHKDWRRPPYDPALHVRVETSTAEWEFEVAEAGDVGADLCLAHALYTACLLRESAV